MKKMMLFIFLFSLFYLTLNKNCDNEINASSASDCTTISTGHNGTICCFIYDPESDEGMCEEYVEGEVDDDSEFEINCQSENYKLGILFLIVLLVL
jgi:hypothetical protein